ncbi:MAG: hypothetical protein ACYC35_19020 [Pirellulales bacterium]
MTEAAPTAEQPPSPDAVVPRPNGLTAAICLPVFARSRGARAGATLAIVVAGYWIYAMAAVPLIEPPADPRKASNLSERDVEAARNVNRRHREEYSFWFPAGSWELDNPKILETERGKLLFRDYRNLGDGKVELRPCTMLFLSSEAQTDEQKRRAVILQAPQGAVLQFDEAFDLRRAKIGKLKAGRLVGPITIRSDQDHPGPGDDLVITGRDLALAGDAVTSPNPVEFRLGPSHGSGRGLRINLTPSADPAKRKSRGLAVEGIQSFELEREVKMYLAIGGDDLLSRKLQAAAKPKGSPAAVPNLASKAEPMPPVEIKCQGPFRFDWAQQVATFQDQVDVLRLNLNGPTDQLTCDTLAVYFAPKTPPPGSPAAPAAGKNAARGGIEPRRIEARGNPVYVRSPGTGTQAVGQRLEYDLRTRRISLEGSRGVLLKQGANEIHARSLYYLPAEDGRLGQLLAYGPGWLRGALPNDPARQVEAKWATELLVRPFQENQVISLRGAAGLNLIGTGSVDAEEIHLWLFETPKPAITNNAAPDKKPQFELTPDRMMARGAVHIDSPQLVGEVDQIQGWFKSLAAPGKTAGARLLPGPSKAEPAGAAAAEPGGARVFAAGSTSPLKPAQRFEIKGGLLQIEVAVGGKAPEVSTLVVQDRVRFAEIETAKPEEKPLVVQGDHLRVLGASAPARIVTVTGRPAHVEARGMAMTGETIELNQGTNRLEIPGPGLMALPVDRDLEGRLLAQPRLLNVEWQNRMTFDGRTASFQRLVTARDEASLMRTGVLAVTLRTPIRFADPPRQGTGAAAELERIACTGGVFLETRTADDRGRPSVQRMEAIDMVIHRGTGDVAMTGPGWLTLVRFGSGNVLLGPGDPGGTSRAAVPPARTPQDDRLMCLDVRFQQSASGNLNRREMVFGDRVRASYGPVESFDARLDTDDPARIGPPAVVLTSERMTVTQMPTEPTGKLALELEAAGNPLVEGRFQRGQAPIETFTARAARMKYAQAKDLLILEGDGRTDAQLFRQQREGGPTSPFAAQIIRYWRGANRVEADRFKMLDLSQFPGPARGGK